jgi:magnesium chelatase family protein
VLEGKKQGFKYFFVPKDNAPEASFIPEVKIIPVDNLQQIIEILSNTKQPIFEQPRQIETTLDYEVDFADIKGNYLQKRALMVAAA